MTSTIKEGRVRSGNSEPAITEENRLAAINSDKKDYSDKAAVYVMSARRTGRAALPKRELGKTERRVINGGVRLANVMRKSETPLPLEVVITDADKTIYFGKGFELEKNISGTDFAKDLSDIVSEGTIKYIAVMLDSFFPFAYVLYGRNDSPEYFAAVPMGGDTDGK